MGESYVRADQRKAFEAHALRELLPDLPAPPVVRVFEMRRPSGGFYSALISFYSTGHVVIFGDLRIGEGPGIVGRCDLALFASPLKGDEEYLCSKFLVPARRPDGPKARRRWDNDAGWLCAAQQRFAELYAELHPAKQEARP